MLHSESAEDYLKTICKMGGTQGAVSTSALASRLGISPVSVHEMIRKLAEQGLVEYTPYRGVSLTPAGLRAAQNVFRRHRLWERFLHDSLGLPWARVHEEAERLEHATSQEVSDRLAQFLNYPQECPHGHPIGQEACTCEDEAARPLLELAAGESAEIERVPEDNAQMLEYLDRLGLRPGVRVTMVEIAPFDGPVTIELDGERKAIGRPLAERILVHIAASHNAENQGG